MAPAGGTKKGAAQGIQSAAGRPEDAQAPRQRLEVPAKSPLVKQLLLRPPVAPVAPPAQRPAIGALPTSELLGRLQQFLPAMHSANAELATDPMAEARPNFLDRKTGEDSEGEDSDDSAAAEPRIVMDLACGVFDLKDDAALAAAARQMSGAAAGMDVEEQDSGSTSSSSDDDCDGDSGPNGGGGGSGVQALLDAEMQERQGVSKAGGKVDSGLSKKKQRQRGRRSRIEEL